jgi:hypothetical protein
MLHIDVFTLATFIKIPNSGHVPIHFFSTKQNSYGALVLGDVFIQNRLINLSSGETLLLKLNYTVTTNNNKYSMVQTVEMNYDENINAWFFLGKNLKYEIYTLIAPFIVSIDLELILPTSIFSTISEVNLTDFDSLALLPSGVHIQFITSDTTTSAKLLTEDPALNAILTIIDGESQHIMNLSITPKIISTSDQIIINEIVLNNKTTIIEQIVLNTFFTNAPGYIKGTLIKTLTGFTPIENLKPGSKLLTHRNRPIEVIKVYQWVSMSYLMYVKNNLLIHKDVLLLSSKGQLQTSQQQNLILAPAKPDLKSYYAIELGGPENKIVLTDNNVVENIGKGLTQHYLTIYKRKLLKIDV